MFEKGDKVICIDAGESRKLRIGQVYTIEVINASRTRAILAEIPDQSWFTSRFRKVVKKRNKKNLPEWW